MPLGRQASLGWPSRLLSAKYNEDAEPIIETDSGWTPERLISTFSEMKLPIYRFSIFTLAGLSIARPMVDPRGFPLYDAERVFLKDPSDLGKFADTFVAASLLQEGYEGFGKDILFLEKHSKCEGRQ